MCEFVDNAGGIIEHAFVIGVAKGHDIVVHHKNLLNLPWMDDIMSQYFQKV